MKIKTLGRVLLTRLHRMVTCYSTLYSIGNFLTQFSWGQCMQEKVVVWAYAYWKWKWTCMIFMFLLIIFSKNIFKLMIKTLVWCSKWSKIMLLSVNYMVWDLIFAVAFLVSFFERVQIFSFSWGDWEINLPYFKWMGQVNSNVNQ
jgi:hypothetical protein